MFHHYSLRGFFGWSFTEQITQIGHKPPLYYGGLPWLLAGDSSLSYAPLLLVNGAALSILLWGCFILGRRLAGDRGGLFALAVVAALPAIAGRVVLVGVETLHLAALVWVFVFVSHLVEEPPSWRPAIGLGAVLGLALLIKWTLAVALLLPSAVILWGVLAADQRAQRLRRLAVAGVLGLGLFCLWLVPFAEISSFTAAAAGEVSTVAHLGSSPRFYLLRWAVSHGLGIATIPAVLLISFTWFGPTGVLLSGTRSRAIPWLPMLLIASVVSVFLVHWFIPHKEPRYVLLAMPGIGILLGAGLALGTQGRSPRWFLAACLSVACLWAGSFFLPYLGDEALPDDYADRHLHHVIVRHDYGLEQLILHPTFADPRGAVISYSLAGERWIELRDLLSWEFYARNKATVISRLPSMPTVDADQASRSLDLASHFITNRPLTPPEIDVLRERGFTPIFEHSLPLPSADAIQLWARDRNRAPLAESLGRPR
jgi:4-amino-4-deoxy-L-arabinose transferase-like glycosyltransferase